MTRLELAQQRLVEIRHFEKNSGSRGYELKRAIPVRPRERSSKFPSRISLTTTCGETSIVVELRECRER